MQRVRDGKAEQSNIPSLAETSRARPDLLLDLLWYFGVASGVGDVLLLAGLHLESLLWY